jgi:hypothetical protein
MSQVVFESSGGQVQFFGFTVSGTAELPLSFTVTSNDISISPAISVTTDTFEMSPGAAKTIEVITDIVSADGDTAGAVGSNLIATPEVRLKDEFGNVATNDSFTQVVVELQSSDPNAYLLGNKIRTVEDGEVSFPNLRVIGQVMNGANLQPDC